MEAKASVTVEPSVNAQWPAFLKSKKKRSNDEKVPNTLKHKLDGSITYEEDKSSETEDGGGLSIDGIVTTLDGFTSLEIGLSLPVSLTLTGKGCDTSCGNPNELTNLS